MQSFVLLIIDIFLEIVVYRNMNLLKLLNLFFTFNNVIYKQHYSIPMGSPLSPVVTDLVMQNLESRTLSLIRSPLLFCYRYIDDIIMVVPTTLINSVLDICNF